jgi:hypothetical protein
MKKEILLLSSLISLAVVIYLGIPNGVNINDDKVVVEKHPQTTPVLNENLEENILLKFDIVRLDPSGGIIMAGKTEPDIVIDIYDGNQKLSSVNSDFHGDWVWVSEKKINDGLKRFNLKHRNSEGQVFNSDENIIIFFEKDVKENQKVVKIKNKNQSGIEIMNNNEQVKGLALDSVEHFDNNKLRLKGRSIPDYEIQIFLSQKLIGKSLVNSNGMWEFSINKIEFNSVDLEIRSSYENNILSLKTKILNGNIDQKLFFEKKIIVEDGNSLWRIARKTLGGGILYAEIYKNNKKIIDDPNLIFPGQVFKIPNLKQSVFYEQR